MEYTDKLEACLFDREEGEIEEILEFLNDENAFRNFGQGLGAFVEKRMPEGYAGSPIDYVRDCLKRKDIYFNRNSLKSWFDGIRPKKGKQSRNNLYCLAFAMDLSVQETVELFRKVYYDRAFNMRDKEEFVYYYCLKNGLEYEAAQRILACVEETAYDKESGEHTIYTRHMAQAVETLDEEMQVVSYINKHPYNFSLNNTQAKKTIATLLKEIRLTEDDLKSVRKKKFCKGESIIMKESFHDERVREFLCEAHKDRCSIQTMLNIIIGIELVDADKYETAKAEAARRAEENAKEATDHEKRDVESKKERVRKEKYRMTFFQNKEFPKEIRNCFPEKRTFSKSDPTYEELRKTIILLFSYKFWELVTYEDYCAENMIDILDIYREEMNAVLYDCSLPTLYEGNPFDWMFMYCTITEWPLITFRDMMSCVFAKDA